MTAAPQVFQDIADGWRPAPQETEEVLGRWPAEALAGVIGAPEPGTDLPTLWHEAYMHPVRRPDELGDDGHPLRDALVPDLPGRRRMFGGGRVHVTAPLRFGDRVCRTSAISSATTRHGRSGWLLLVTERHEYTVAGALRLVDERDVVYRLPADVSGRGAGADKEDQAASASDGGAVPESSPQSAGSLHLDPDERLLFLFSALTYNAHRIHYDRDYATGVEGHPGLVVHGPLMAVAGLEAACRTLSGQPTDVEYRLVAPAFAGGRIEFRPEAAENGSVRVEGFQGVRKCLTMTANRTETGGPR